MRNIYPIAGIRDMDLGGMQEWEVGRHDHPTPTRIRAILGVACIPLGN